MARVAGTEAFRHIGWALARAIPIVALGLGWEVLASSGLVTPFQLPRFSAVLGRIWADAMTGDLVLNTALTLYRALAGFTVAAMSMNCRSKLPSGRFTFRTSRTSARSAL